MKTVLTLLIKYPRTALTAAALIIFVLTTYARVAYEQSELVPEMAHLHSAFTWEPQLYMIVCLIINMQLAATLVMASANTRLLRGAFHIKDLPDMTDKVTVSHVRRLFRIFPWKPQVAVAHVTAVKVVSLNEVVINHYIVIFSANTPLPSEWALANGFETL